MCDGDGVRACVRNRTRFFSCALYFDRVLGALNLQKKNKKKTLLFCFPSRKRDKNSTCATSVTNKAAERPQMQDAGSNDRTRTRFESIKEKRKRALRV